MKKRKSPREKGNAYQIWIRDWLQDRGWTVRNFPMISKPPIEVPDKKHPGKKILIWLHQDNDVFGSDLIAMKGKVRLWIQASLGTNITRKVEGFAKYFTSLGPYEILMIWIKRENWHSLKRVYIAESIIKIEDTGKIQVGKFYPAKGSYMFMFGEKIKKKKKVKK